MLVNAFTISGMVLPPQLADADFCYLTTTGRVSGRPHTIEIWFAADGPTLYLLSGAGGVADWVRNLTADPAVSVRIGDRHWPARASVVEDAGERDRVAALVYAKYQPRYAGDLSEWRRSALPVALTLAES